MVALKGNPNIGDLINKKIIGPPANANKLSDMPDFNDDGKLGSGKTKSTGSPTSSLSSRTRHSTSQKTAPMAMTSSAMRMNT